MKEIDKKNIKESENKLEKLKLKYEENPEDIDIIKQLADINIELNKFEDAIVYLSKLLELKPNYARGYNQIGICYFNLGRLDQAEKNLINALKLDFNLIETHFNLGLLYQKRKQHKKALSHFKEIVLRDPEDYMAYYRMAKSALAISMNKEAEEFLKESIRLKPDFLDASADLSTLYIKQGKLNSAEKVLSEILKYHPKEINLHFSLGLVLKEQKKYLEAITHFREVVILDENNAEALNYLGECCIETGMNQQAEPFLAKAIKLHPDYYDAIFNLGKLYWDEERKDDAIMVFQEYLSVIDRLYEKKEKWGEEVSKEIYIPVYNLLGEAYMEKGRKNEAKEWWEKSLEINPEQPEIKNALAKISRPLRKKVSLTID